MMKSSSSSSLTMMMGFLSLSLLLLLLLITPNNGVMGSFYSLKKHRKFLAAQHHHDTTRRTLQEINTCPEGYDDDDGLAQHPLAQQYGLTNCANTLETLVAYMGNSDLLCLSIGVGLCNCTCAGIDVLPSTKLDAVPYLETTEEDLDGNNNNNGAFSCDQVLIHGEGNSKAAQLLPSYYEGFSSTTDDEEEGEWKCSELGDVGVVLWQVDPTKETITFASEFISAGGGAAIGISSNGGMKGADLLVVTKSQEDQEEEEEWILKDMFSTGYSYDGSLITLDDTQDAKLEWSDEDMDRVAFVVTRPIKSCDSETDLEILSGRVPFIWARFPTHGSDVVYHGPGRQSRGTVYLDLLSDDPQGVNNQLPEDPADLYTVDMRMHTTDGERYTLPNGQVNTYACQSFELPSDQPYHLVSYEAILDTAQTTAIEDLNVVHHIVMYSCDADPHTTEPKECGSMAALCQGVELAWAVGMPPQYLPDVAGLPLKKHVMLEMHYENLSQQPNIMDGSGIRITLTPQLRQYDFGYIIVGTDLGDTKELEPGQEDVVRQGFCPTECLARNLPETGVQVHGQFFHSHIQGRSLFTQHYNNVDGPNNNMLPPTMLGDMPYYDFNHQSFKYYGNEPRLYPGDTLVTTCHYNTMDQSNPTEFGLETSEEMCFNIIGMYPLIDLKYCWNSTETGGWCTIPETEPDENGVYDEEGWKYVDSPLPSHSSLYVPGGAKGNGNTNTEGCVELDDEKDVPPLQEGGDSKEEEDPSTAKSSSNNIVMAEDDENSSSVTGIVVGVIVGALVVASGVFLWYRGRGGQSESSGGGAAAESSAGDGQPLSKHDEEKGASSSAMTSPGGTSSFMS